MTPTRYRITVRGEISPRLAVAFEPLECRTAVGLTHIEGEITDQSHLYGVLLRIRDLGAELVGVEPLRWEPGLVTTQTEKGAA